jgi:hypothetical protein
MGAYRFLTRLFLDGSNLHLVNEEAFLDIFGHLVQLETLSLSGSKVEFVSAAAFAHFRNMTALYLRDNSITIVPKRML